ncbi:phosphotransferase [Actinokineospora enzanensis]|uniref:phosphotransferase n=1 Tax=Actinokineospora enzanensis TaxID=155975 RepID=UPI0012EBB4E5|nr:phosphotransferase [Actinokineospora enzanensis]
MRIIAHGQPGDGIEASAHLDGVAKPRWHAAVTWLDEDTVWRADEVDHVQGTPIRQGASLATASTLSPAWWHTFNQSLDALAAHHTTRTATPDTQLITQDLVTTTIDQVFPGQVDTRLDILDWVPTHADLNWSNLLAPDCAIIDWEDFGLAPRGLDAATLWITSLSVPDLAERIHQERLADLANPSGRLMALFHCAKILSDTTEPHDSLYASVQAVAADLMAKQDLAPS